VTVTTAGNYDSSNPDHLSRRGIAGMTIRHALY
jgi:hypothetical protein